MKGLGSARLRSVIATKMYVRELQEVFVSIAA